MYRVLYLNEVENDIAVAKQWYSEQQKDLEVRFAAAVKETFSTHQSFSVQRSLLH